MKSNNVTGKCSSFPSMINQSEFKTIGDETKPLMEFTEKLDEHGKQNPHIKLDKTQIIQEFIDFLEEYVPHPNNPFVEDYQRLRFMIPNHPDSKAQIDFIFHDWTQLVRVDLPEELEKDEIKKKIFMKKQFSHPSDSLIACIYAFNGHKIKNYWNYVGV